MTTGHGRHEHMVDATGAPDVTGLVEPAGMKISMVSEHANPLAAVGGVDAGGQNVHVAALATALAAEGHEVTVFTRRDDPAVPDGVAMGPGVTVEHITAGPATVLPKDELLPFMPEMGRQLARRWSNAPPDVVHSHFWMSGLAALVGVKELDIPVVHTFHALGRVKRRHQGDKDTSPSARLRLEAAVARGVDRLIATSNDEVGELLEMGASRQRIDVIPCGVDVEMFTESGEVHPPRGDRPRVVGLGRLVERKGFDVLIAAMRAVPEAELLIAGGPPEDELDSDPEARRLREVARRHGVEGRVRLLGRVAREDVPPLLRSSDLVACVPWYEPFGIVPLEAMACGRPVVGTAVGGLLDTITEGATGVLVPPRDSAALAQAIRELLRDRVRLQGYGLAGVERVHTRYRWSQVAAETARVYGEVAARRIRHHRVAG